MIQIRNLKKTFGNLTVLHDVNIDIKRGEVISIIGPSGTGKSTFLRCLNLLEEPTSGSIVVDGEELLSDEKVDAPKLRRKMGMVFQSFNLFDHLSVLENVCIACTTCLLCPEGTTNITRSVRGMSSSGKVLRVASN